MGLFTTKNSIVPANEYLIYQANDFDASKKAYNIMSNPVGANEAIHVFAHGLTFGSMAHMAAHANTWASLSDNVYRNAMANPRLRAFRCGRGSQVVIAGGNYITVYQNGEYGKKIINYQDIVKIAMYGDNNVIYFKNYDGKYMMVKLLSAEEGNNVMMNAIAGYFQKFLNRNFRNA